MNIIKGKEIYAPTLLALIPITIHWPTSENAHNNESAVYKQNGVYAEKNEKAEMRIEAVKGE